MYVRIMYVDIYTYILYYMYHIYVLYILLIFIYIYYITKVNYAINRTYEKVFTTDSSTQIKKLSPLTNYLL